MKEQIEIYAIDYRWKSGDITTSYGLKSGGLQKDLYEFARMLIDEQGMGRSTSFVNKTGFRIENFSNPNESESIPIRILTRGLHRDEMENLEKAILEF